MLSHKNFDTGTNKLFHKCDGCKTIKKRPEQNGSIIVRFFPENSSCFDCIRFWNNPKNGETDNYKESQK